MKWRSGAAQQDCGSGSSIGRFKSRRSRRSRRMAGGGGAGDGDKTLISQL